MDLNHSELLDYVAEEVRMNLNTGSKEPVSIQQVKAPYTVVWPELVVASVDLDPGSPRANEIVTVRLHLYNGGPCEVMNVTVTMVGAEAERLASIGPGGEATVVFIWATGEPGEATLRGDVAFGPGDHRQAWSHGFEVAGEEPDGAAFSRWWAPAVAVMVAIVLLLLAIVFKRHPRLTGTVSLEETPLR